MGVRQLNRRQAISQITRATAAMAVLGYGCTRSSTTSSSTPARPSTTTTTQAPTAPLGPPRGPGFSWAAVEYGAAKPYILHRDDGAVLVDTGRIGSGQAIQDVLVGLGLGWSDIRHIILTHHHRDNVGGLTEVSALAPDAQIWAGQADIADLPRVEAPVMATDGSERIFDLTIIETPGHTPGHVSVLDEVSGTLVDGDLLVVRRGEIYGPTRESSDDVDQAYASLRELAEYDFDTILIARGDPILTDGQEVMKLVSSGLGR